MSFQATISVESDNRKLRPDDQTSNHLIPFIFRQLIAGVSTNLGVH